MKHLIAALVVSVALASPALAQQTPAPAAPGQARPAPPPDPRLVAAEQAFMALPEAERKAIQQDLGFATSFNGAALGTFGALTFTGIQNFERDNKLTVDGVLSPQERQLLATAARNARAALKFAVLDDARSGVKIGVPQGVFSKREANAVGGSRWQTADGKATLETTALPKDGETLQQHYEKALVSSNPARKVTYKLLRPDFFVVAGETPTGKFYRRMTLGADGALRGFSVGYDKALAGEMDKLVISVANHFEAFPGQAAAAARPAGAAGAPVAAPAVPAPPPGPRLASALLLDGGHLLTSAAALKDCKALAAGPRRLAARIVASDADTGLALLKAEGLTRSGPMAGFGGPVQADASLTLVGQAWSGNAPSGVFAEAVVVGGGRIAAPLQPGGAGAALFNASGALAGLVTDDPGARKQVAGVVPAARYRFATAESLAAFLQKNGITPPRTEAAPLSGGVAASRRETVTALICSL